MARPGFTSIDDLDDPIPHGKFIRDTRVNIPPESGMGRMTPPQPIGLQRPATAAPMHAQPVGDMEPYEEIPSSSSNITCREVMDHIQECPICIRIYSSDKTIYMLMFFIVVLFILLVIAGKKIMSS